MKKEIDRCEQEANVTASRAAYTFIGIICMQFALSQYGTYYALSWDIIEPITACVSLSDACAGYFFWLWAGKPWDMNELRKFFFHRKLNKLFKRKDINGAKYETLLECKREIKRKLYHGTHK